MEDNEVLLDVLNILLEEHQQKELNKKKLKDANTFKWFSYIGITVLTIFIIGKLIDGIKDKAPIILCFGILYIIAIFITNIYFTNKMQELLKKYNQDDKQD